MVESKNVVINPLKRLQEYSITGYSADLRKQMLQDIYILTDIALLGQWTTIYAAPNTGKTLITLWLLKEAIDDRRLNGDLIFYVNADDNFKGIVEKTELAEKWGFHLLAPNQRGFHTNQITQLMIDLVTEEQARGVTIILDTLKKFTDLMHKKEASEFGIIGRNFVSSGGTLICLAHTNKHKNSEGKSVYSGTSDIRDDSDCAFIIDKIESSIFDYEIVVEFVNDKARGDVVDRVSFMYSKKIGQSYLELIESVKRIDDKKLNEKKALALQKKKLDEDQELIDAVHKMITTGITTKSSLIKSVWAETGIPQNRIRKILADRSGNNYMLGDRWQVKVGAHNKNEYTLLEPNFSDK